MTEFTAIAYFMILSCLVLICCCDSPGSNGNWMESTPQIRVHEVFVPHPHIKDSGRAGKYRKILVITLVAAAGLVALVTIAIIRSGKKKMNLMATVDPAELRACAIAAVVAGKRGLAKSQEEALSMAFSAYAEARGMEWENETLEDLSQVTCSIGKDRVTAIISDSRSRMEIRAISGSVGASAAADAADDSIESSVFTSRALKKKES